MARRPRTVRQPDVRISISDRRLLIHQASAGVPTQAAMRSGCQEAQKNNKRTDVRDKSGTAPSACAEAWGILGTDVLAEERRVRSLGLAPAVRWYNDAAVPGLGGIWFAKPLVISMLGIELAAQHAMRPVVVANAVEALSCWFAINKLERFRDPRLRGSQKLASKACPAFAEASRPNYYVTQPMRQQTVQPLRALGLVESAASDRFNAYRVSDAGKRILEAAFRDAKPFNSSVSAVLGRWISGKSESIGNSDLLARALSPTESMSSEARLLLREQLVGGDGRRDRRAAALAWVSGPAAAPAADWNSRPVVIDPDHWQDLHAGAQFFTVRDAALRVLQAVELKLSNESEVRVPLRSRWETLEESSAALRSTAQAFLSRCRDTSPGALAARFCQECCRVDGAELLRSLVARDDRVLRLKGTDIVPGPAFKTIQEFYGAPGAGDFADEDSIDLIGDQRWPSGVSRRIPALHTIAIDLDGRLELHLRANGVPA